MTRLRRFRELVRSAGFSGAVSITRSWLRWKLGGSPVPKAPVSGNDWFQVHENTRPRAAVGSSRISIIIPVYQPVEAHLRACIDSIRSQTYPNWDLVLVEDASPGGHVRPLLEDIASTDSRISVVLREENGGIAAATNTGIEAVAGEFIAFVDQDDLLGRTALEWVATCTDHADLIYTDEAKIDDAGVIGDRVLKPSWSPRLLLGYNYISHLTVVRTALVRRIGGITDGSSGAQDHDFLLRVAEEPVTVAHIPSMLYLWRRSGTSTASDAAAKPYAEVAGLAAVDTAIKRRGWHAEAVLGRGVPFRYAVRWGAPEHRPTIKVIIPTRDRIELLGAAVSSLFGRTDGVDLHLVVVDNGSVEAETRTYLAQLATRDDVTIVRHDDAFNFSRLCNLGVSSGPHAEYVLFLNNDVEVLHRGWLRQMAGWFVDPGVVAVGTELLYDDRETIQHGGVALGTGHIAWHLSGGLPNEPRLGDPHDTAHEVAGVTAACMLVRTAAFDAVGGFEEILPTDFQDVDLCLKLTRDLGGVIVYEPMYPLLHHESASREDVNAGSGYTVHRMQFRWPGIATETDPYFHPLSAQPYLGEFARIAIDGSFVERIQPRVTSTLGMHKPDGTEPVSDSNERTR